MDIHLKSKKDKILSLFAEICGDQSNNVLESKGMSLYQNKVKLSLDLHEQLFHSFKIFASENPDVVDMDVELSTLEEVLLQSITISSQYSKFKQVLAKVKDRLEKSEIQLLTSMELDEAIHLSLNDDTLPINFYDNDEEVYRIFVQVYCTNAAISSGLFTNGATILVSDLEETNPRVAFHVKKTALDQACASVFKNYSPNYDDLLYVETLDQNSPIAQLSPVKLKDDEIAFAYVNVNKMDALYFPKFIELIDPKSGKTCYVKEVIHESPEMRIPCKIADQNVFVKLNVYKGIILTTIKEYDHKE